MRTRRVPPLWVLLVIVLADYLFQVPYYLVNYYLPNRTLPSVSALLLLSLTLLWFLTGYLSIRAGRRFGAWVLGGFLLVEGGFYLSSAIGGALSQQFASRSIVNVAVFGVGYLTGITSLFYLAFLIAFRGRYLDRRAMKSAAHSRPPFD